MMVYDEPSLSIYMYRICLTCKRKYRVRKKKQKYCSPTCVNKGPGRMVNSSGYWMVLRRGHPMARKSGYVLEHRLMMAESIGRMLTKEEVVDHINGDRTDNRIENLRILTASVHSKIGFRAYGYSEEVKRAMAEKRQAYRKRIKCAYCKKEILKKSAVAKYCGSLCRNRALRPPKGKRQSACRQCGKRMEITTAQKLFCSNACSLASRYKPRSQVEITCPICAERKMVRKGSKTCGAKSCAFKHWYRTYRSA